MANELSGVQVATLGLVEQGANQEQFFLLKEDSPNLLDRVVAAVRSVFSEKTVKSEEVAMAEEVVTKQETTTEATLTTETITSTASEPVAVVETVVSGVSEVAKSDERLVALEKMIEDQNKAIEELRVELVKTAERAKSAEDTVVGRTALEKARSYVGIPAKIEDTAKYLARLEKSDSEAAEWFHALLKAVSAMLVDSGLYKEAGTTKTPETDVLAKVEAITKNGGTSFRDALLGLSKEEKEAFVAQMREKVGGK